MLRKISKKNPSSLKPSLKTTPVISGKKTPSFTPLASNSALISKPISSGQFAPRSFSTAAPKQFSQKINHNSLTIRSKNVLPQKPRMIAVQKINSHLSSSKTFTQKFSRVAVPKSLTDHGHIHRSFKTSSKTLEKIPEAEVVDQHRDFDKETDDLQKKFERMQKEASAKPQKAQETDSDLEVEIQMPESKEQVSGKSTAHEFQAETRKLLDIVARSLYTDREIFVRELISNASDALEKLRHRTLIEKINLANPDFQINIWTNSKDGTLTIQDNGVGMTQDELVKNLGNIGHSGSLEYLEKASDQNAKEIIGQFGVGFYSAFMVGKRVKVYSRSIDSDTGYLWESDGSGTYDIAPCENVSQGTKIVVQLNSKSIEFSQKEAIERIIKKYSTFVGFPIKLNGSQVNTIKALWTMSKDEVSEKDHIEFYQFISHAYDEPRYHLLYAADSPIHIRSVFYIGQQHGERYGMGRLEPGVNLYSRKVLIQSKAKGLLPDWMRFIKGVIDSEDLPLNLSREFLQDSALIKRIGNVMSKRILKWMEDSAKADPREYKKFWNEFNNFIKEGVCTDVDRKEDIAKLLRFESSSTSANEETSLDQYIDRMPPSQKNIYYLIAPSRPLAETSPYYEAFKANNMEVLFLFSNMDDFVMNNLQNYRGKKLVSVESGEAAELLKKSEESKPDDKKPSKESQGVVDYLKVVLASKVSSVKESTRLVDSPAIIVDHESASFRRMMKYVDPSKAPELPRQQLEVNPNHPLIIRLNQIRETKPNLAKTVADQMFDNALSAAGLLDDSRVMVPRLNNLLLNALEGEELNRELKK